MFKAFSLSVVLALMTVFPAGAQEQEVVSSRIFTVREFKDFPAEPGIQYSVRGFMVDLYECRPCPPDAVCPTCPGEYIIISDSPHKSEEEEPAGELKLLSRAVSIEVMKRWTKKMFTVQKSEHDNQLELTAWADDLTFEFTHKICVDDAELFDCKPRIMHAIEENNFTLVRKVVESGVDVNIDYPYYYGKTALMHAVDEGREDIVLYLLENGADPDVVIPLDPLKAAEDLGHTAIADAIRKFRARSRR